MIMKLQIHFITNVIANRQIFNIFILLVLLL